MPQIPLTGAPDVPQTQSPDVRANPGMYDAVGEAGSRLGGAVSSVGSLAFRIRNAVDSATLIKTDTQMRATLQDFQNELNDPSNPKNGDESTYASRWQAKLDGFKQSAMKDPKVQGLSPAAQMHLQTSMDGFERESGVQVNHIATQKSIQQARAVYDIGYQSAVRNGDADTAIKLTNSAESHGIQGHEEAAAKRYAVPRLVDYHQASQMIMRDPETGGGPIVAEDALQEQKDGKYVNYPHLTDKERGDLVNEAHRRSQALKIETSQDLFERQHAGENIGSEEVEHKIQLGLLSRAQAKPYLSPPKTFEAQQFGDLYTRIANYDPVKDVNHNELGGIWGDIGHVAGPGGTQLAELLKEKTKPDSIHNSPTNKEATKVIDDAFTNGFLGKWSNRIKDDTTGQWQTVNNPTIWQAATQRKTQLYTALADFMKANPKATPAEASSFVFKQIGQGRQKAAASLFFSPPSVTPTAPKK